MVGSGIGLVLILIYYLLLQFGQEAGRNGSLPPSFAMWIPNIVIGLLGVGFNAHTMLSGRLDARRFRKQQSRLESDTAASSAEIEDSSSSVKSESAQASDKSPPRGGPQGVGLSQIGLRIFLFRYLFVEYLENIPASACFPYGTCCYRSFFGQGVSSDSMRISPTGQRFKLYCIRAPRRIMEVVPIAGFLAVFFLLGPEC